MLNADLAKQILETDGFFKNHTVDIKRLSEGDVEISVPMEEGVQRMGGIMSGAAIMAFSDLASAFCALTDENVVNEVSSSLNTNFYRPISQGPASFRAVMRKSGRKIAYTHVEVRDAGGKLCAESNGIYYLYRQEG